MLQLLLLRLLQAAALALLYAQPQCPVPSPPTTGSCGCGCSWSLRCSCGSQFCPPAAGHLGPVFPRAAHVVSPPSVADAEDFVRTGAPAPGHHPPLPSPLPLLCYCHWLIVGHLPRSDFVDGFVATTTAQRLATQRGWRLLATAEQWRRRWR